MRLFGMVIAAYFVTLLNFSTWAQNPSDPFERQLFFSKDSLYPGERMDLSATRNLIALTDAQIVSYGFSASLNTIDRRFYYVANFRHQDSYWVAKIPKSGVERSIFQYQNLSSSKLPTKIMNWVRMGHIQMRFQMKASSPLELRPQNLQQKSPVLQLRDFSYALNAVRSVTQKGKTYNPLGDGLKKGYGFSHTFISTRDTADSVHKFKSNIEQYPMTFSEQKSHDDLLNAYILKSLGSIESVSYNTISQSCVTSTMEGIYTVVPNRPVIWWGRVWRNWRVLAQSLGTKYEYNPRAVVALLIKQGYIVESERIKNLEEQMK